jgi:hypothetical protein
MTKNELLKLAIEEAYASAPQDTIPLHSLEINHKTFTEPIRIVRWPAVGEELEKFNCLIEDDAEYNPGQVVEFLGVPFELVLPEKDTENPGQFRVSVDNVGDLLDEYMENAALGGGKITAVYREYIKGQELDGPASVWPHMTLSSPHLEGMTFVMNGAVLDWMFRAFGRLMLPGDYPGIVIGR